MNIKKTIFALSTLASYASAMDSECTKNNDFAADAQKVASAFRENLRPDICLTSMIGKYKQECGLQPFGLENNECSNLKRALLHKELEKLGIKRNAEKNS